MGYRTSYVMVEEDDPRWLKFWNSYPRRDSKKEARKAFAVLNPSMALVEKIVEALAWQSEQWTDRRYTPLPATYLNAERWTDEAPLATTKRAATVAGCGHTPVCFNESACAHLTKYPNGFPLRVVNE